MMFTLNFNQLTCVRGVILLFLLCLVLVYRVHHDTVRFEKTSKMIYMLQWTSALKEPISYMGKGVQTFGDRQCPIRNCYVTSNRDLLGGITNFDVLIFHGREIIGDYAMTMPAERSRDQIYVFASMESSGYYPVLSNVYEEYFNATWTYKLESDIYFGYFMIRNKNGELIGPSAEMQWMAENEMLPINPAIKQKIANKTIAAAWFVSNCNSLGRREHLVKEIQKEMKVYGLSLDVYGRCGNKKCGRSSMHKCLKLLENDYYFYFAFENSFAEDYVTEKLLHALQNYAVPVVYGGADYKRFMPNGAYLDATVLTPKELVKRMFQIIEEPENYYEFFKWMNHYSYHDIEDSPDTDPFCKLCKYANRMKLQNKTNVVTEFEDWWNPHPDQWNKSYEFTRGRKKSKVF